MGQTKSLMAPEENKTLSFLPKKIQAFPLFQSSLDQKS